MTNTWVLWAEDRNGKFYHIGSKDYTRLCSIKNPVEIELTANPEGDYWGHLRTGSTVPSMIYPNQTLFSICFPYGSEASEKAGQGKVMRFIVRKL